MGSFGSFETLEIRRNAGCECFAELGFLEYFEDFPGIEGRDGEDGVPIDLKVVVAVPPVEVVVALSLMLAIFEAESKRFSRRISSSISFRERLWWLNLSAFALFQREKRISVAGRLLWDGHGGGKIGN